MDGVPTLTGNLPTATDGVAAPPTIAQVPSVPSQVAVPGGEAMSPASSPGAIQPPQSVEEAERLLDQMLGRAPAAAAQTPPMAYAPPAPQVAPTPPQASPVEQELAVLKAQLQAQQQYMQEFLARQTQAPQQQVDPYAQMEAELRAARLNPADPVHQALYAQHVQMQRMQEAMQQQAQQYAALQQQARQYTLQSSLEPQVMQPFAAVGVSSLPDTMKQAIVRDAVAYAQQGASPQQAAALAAKPYLDFYQATRPAPAPQASVTPIRPPQAGQAPNPIAAVAVPGHTAGKATRPFTIEDAENILKRAF